jgi:hypothetical protein
MILNNFSNNWKKIIELNKKIKELSQEYLLLEEDVILQDLTSAFSKNSLVWYWEIIELVNPKTLELYFDKLVYFASYGNPTDIEHSRRIILELDRTFVISNIEQVLELIIVESLIEDAWLDYFYLNIVALYNLLNLNKNRNQFLIKYCKNHQIEEISEIYDDYYEE